ncbi:MAG: DUF86 domain-containing protein [Chloroflexota bacterium]|nr:DUF86 domain-containing protein [Chloroflexota bacterium]
MNDHDKALLQDMREAARKAIEYTRGKTRETLVEDDELIGFAVVRAIEIIGEAANRVSSETQTTFTTIPWRRVIGMRNRIVHDYLNVDYDIVWEVITEGLPALMLELDSILRDEAN